MSDNPSWEKKEKIIQKTCCRPFSYLLFFFSLDDHSSRPILKREKAIFNSTVGRFITSISGLASKLGFHIDSRTLRQLKVIGGETRDPGTDMKEKKASERG